MRQRLLSSGLLSVRAQIMSTDGLEKSLISYIAASANARQVLSQFRGMEISALDVQRALCDRLGIDESNSSALLSHNLSTESILQLLVDFDFRRFHPEVLAEIELIDPVIPTSIPRLLTEQTVKVKGEVWQVHKNDADPFPSNPHAHNYDAGVVLHLGTGEMFDRNRNSKGLIGKKALKTLRDQLKGVELPALEP